MDDFAENILASYALKQNDCLPVFDSGHRIVYGRHTASPIRLEVEFTQKKMVIQRLLIYDRYQKQGLGRTIVEYLKRECQRLHLTEIELQNILRESAVFWEKCGFSVNVPYGRWEVPEG